MSPHLGGTSLIFLLAAQCFAMGMKWALLWADRSQVGACVRLCPMHVLSRAAMG